MWKADSPLEMAELAHPVVVLPPGQSFPQRRIDKRLDFRSRQTLVVVSKLVLE